MIGTDITINILAEAISGNVVCADDFRCTNGFHGIFNILKDANEGDIVIRHWIDEKGIKIASSKNVACIITEDPRGNSVELATELKIPLIIVEKIEEANAIALNWTLKKFAPNSKRVVISGTNGKSTTSHMVNHILKTTGAHTITNTDSKSEFNTLIDPMVPKLISEYVLTHDEFLDYVVIEASEVQGWLGKLMNDHAYLMTKAVDPDVAVVTNVGMDHIGLVNSLEEVFHETSGVAKAIDKGTLVLNSGDKKVLSMADYADEGVNIFYFSLVDDSSIEKNKNNVSDNQSNNNVSNNQSTSDFLYYDSNLEAIVYGSKNILTLDELPLKSNHFIQNILAAIAVCISLKIDIEDIVKGVKSYKPLKRRFRTINNNPLVIDDFAHNPEGIKATVNAVSELANEKLKVLYAIRGSRGEEINKINIEALAEVINNNSQDKNNKELILSSSSDVVDEANFVEEFEEEVSFNVLKGENIKYVHYKKLYDALIDVYNSTGINDTILLIGAQGMDPAEKILENIIKNKN